MRCNYSVRPAVYAMGAPGPIWVETMQRSVRIAGGVLGLVLSSGGATAMRAQSDSASPRPAVSAVRLVGQIVLDGRLSEDVWRTTPAAAALR